MNKKNLLLIILTAVLVAILMAAYVIYHQYQHKTGKNQLQPVAPSQTQQTQPEEETAAQTPSADENTAAEEEKDDRAKAPDFTMENAEGETVCLSDFEGKPVVLNFWASWCPPCKEEMPEFDSVYQEMGEEVCFMMVNLTDGERETRSSALDYVKDLGYVFPVYLDTEQEGAMEYWVTSIPTTFFIDKDGYIAARAVGAIDKDTLLDGIRMAKGE